MHTFRHEESDVTILHEGDYTGDAVILVPASPGSEEKVQLTVPCVALTAFVADMVRQKLIGDLEQSTIESLLRLKR